MYAELTLFHHCLNGLQLTINQRKTCREVPGVLLDIVKTFNKVNHHCLYIKLMHYNVPVHFLNATIS